MANLSRYDPLNLARIDPFGDIDDLLKGFFVRPALFEGQPFSCGLRSSKASRRCRSRWM